MKELKNVGHLVIIIITYASSLVSMSHWSMKQECEMADAKSTTSYFLGPTFLGPIK